MGPGNHELDEGAQIAYGKGQFCGTDGRRYVTYMEIAAPAWRPLPEYIIIIINLFFTMN